MKQAFRWVGAAHLFGIVAFLLPCRTGASQTSAPGPATPHLEQRGKATQLIVDGKPFLVLGGELHNSSSSSLEYMKPVWARLAAMHLNTVILPVAWETIEPEESKFDFSNVDGLLAGARQNNLKLVLLWFGSWKNTFSSYVPAWVKKDGTRFPRALLSSGRGTERLSTFGDASREADARAFARLMQHLRQIDAQDHTVLIVQVENEVGVLLESRDYLPAANAAFGSAVPTALMAFLQEHRTALSPDLRAAWEAAGNKASGTWQEVFGSDPLTDDLFMAWHYALYIEKVTRAGKAEYGLPMYTNAALIRPNYLPGQYNSGGPLPHSMDIWHAGAPSLDFLSPDIYFNEFALWAQRYRRPDNLLFIPEAQGGAAGAANALYAFGQQAAIGFSPFGIDDIGNTPLDLVGITNGEHPDNLATSDAFKRLALLAPLILEKQSSGQIGAALIEGDAQRSAKLFIGSYTATLTRAGGAQGAGTRIGAMFLQTGPDEFLVVGSGDAQVTFASEQPGPPVVGVTSIDEEVMEGGALKPLRRMNGDENSQGQSLRLHASDAAEGKLYLVRLYRYR